MQILVAGPRKGYNLWAATTAIGEYDRSVKWPSLLRREDYMDGATGSSIKRCRTVIAFKEISADIGSPNVDVAREVERCSTRIG